MPHTLQPIVFVIESPSPRDVLDGRREGEALCSALRLAEISTQYYAAVDRATVEESFDRATIAVRSQTRYVPGQEPFHTTFVPHFHFSAHGNESGVGLTSGEFVPWSYLRDLLLAFARSTGRLDDKGVALLTLTFSACRGANAAKLFLPGPPQPCFAIVGPTNDVTWPDSLAAYVTFFHHTIHKDAHAREAVSLMNLAAGLGDVFQCTTYQGAGA